MSQDKITVKTVSYARQFLLLRRLCLLGLACCTDDCPKCPLDSDSGEYAADVLVRSLNKSSMLATVLYDSGTHGHEYWPG